MEVMAIQQMARPFPIHFHDTYVIEMVVEGIDTCIFDNECAYAREGDIFVISPFQAHSGGNYGTDRIAYLSAYPSQRRLDEISAKFNLREAAFDRNVIRDPILSKSLQDAHQSAVHDRKEEPLELALAELIDRHAARKSNRPGEKTMHDAAAVMLDRCRENRSVEDWAHHFGYSPFHFLRRFTRFTGMTPHRFLNAARIDWARKMLRAGARTSLVAVEAGFYDQAHFTKVFHSVVGMTPGDYSRKSNPIQDKAA